MFYFCNCWINGKENDIFISAFVSLVLRLIHDHCVLIMGLQFVSYKNIMKLKTYKIIIYQWWYCPQLRLSPAPLSSACPENPPCSFSPCLDRFQNFSLLNTDVSLNHYCCWIVIMRNKPNMSLIFDKLSVIWLILQRVFTWWLKVLMAKWFDLP